MFKSPSNTYSPKPIQYQSYVSDPNSLLLQKIQDTLQQSNTSLPNSQFQVIYRNIISQCIKRAQIQKNEAVYISFLKRIVSKYKPTLQITVRLMLFQVKHKCSMPPQNRMQLLTKVKYIIVDTQLEYLLTKIFLLQAQIYEQGGDLQLQSKSLRKCIEYAQNCLIQYLKQIQQIRHQISQTIVIAYIQLYKLNQESSPLQSQQYLRKAVRSTQKLYGNEHQITNMLNSISKQQQNIRKSLQKKLSSNSHQQRAVTQILSEQIQKSIKVSGFYLWEDQKIIVEMFKETKYHTNVINRVQYSIRLDMSKINALKNIQWIHILNEQISILEDELLKAIGIKQEQTAVTRIGFRQITRDEIIKKDALSSSSQDVSSFIEKEDFNFIRKLGRTQSAKRQQRKKQKQKY